MKKYLKLMRIKHYIKNILVLLPLVFSGKLFDVELLKINLLGFISFCFIASFIYVINDIVDVKQDRLHPIKCKRPIASGEIEIKNAIIFSLILFIISAIFNYLVALGGGTLVWILWCTYILINFAYSFGLKKVPVVDILFLASGFLIRVLYGGAISNINISYWMCGVVFALSLYMGLGKRRNEAVNQGECVRSVLKYYNSKVLNVLMDICLGLTVVFYSCWCVFGVINRVFSRIIYISILMVVAIIAKYSFDIKGKVDGDPINVMLKDRVEILGSIMYGLFMYFVMYC